jgi:hypothetical protein
VPIVFCETRPLAAEWAYRFLGAALDELASHGRADQIAASLPFAGEVPPPAVTTAEVRAWAVAAGLPVSDRGRLRPDVWAAYRAAHG